MTDRELLEAAARAAGMDVLWRHWPSTSKGCFYLPTDLSSKADGLLYKSWNPLTDDGDRWRLAESLGLTINFATGNVYGPQNSGVHVNTASTGKSLAWCVVRAAAAMGEKA